MQREHPAIEAVGLSRTHRVGRQTIQSLTDVSLTIDRGEIVAVMGPSGSGKSTLLHLLGGLDDPDKGRAMITGVDWRTLRGKARARFRWSACGFVTQTLALLPQATAAENVEAALLLGGVEMCERRSRTTEALERVGLIAERAKLPDQLSGGQQQRVAIARALVTRPAVVLADEPTGNLDSATAEAIAELLVTYAGEQHAAVVLVTHDPAIASYAHRVVALHSGHIGLPVTRKRVVRRVRTERGRVRRDHRRDIDSEQLPRVGTPIAGGKPPGEITPIRPEITPIRPEITAVTPDQPDGDRTQRVYVNDEVTQVIDADQTQRIAVRSEESNPGGTP